MGSEKKTIWVFGQKRVEFLDASLIRIEIRGEKGFCDEDTFFVPDRSSFSGFAEVRFEEKERIGAFSWNGFTLKVPLSGSSLRGLFLEKGGQIIYRYRPLFNNGELPPFGRAPAVFPLLDSPRILVPSGGYSYHGSVPESGYLIEENAQDLYLFLAQCDDALLRKLYVSLTGKSPLLPLGMFGSWNSKYYIYTEQSAEEVICDYQKHRVPLDNLVIDTDWRDAKEGWGYEVNADLFPDIHRFFSFAHQHRVEVMFNDHPEPVAGCADLLAPAEVAYREKNLQAILKEGLDYWWYDRNWTCALVSPTSSLSHETWGMYLYDDIVRHYRFQEVADPIRARRSACMSNVSNIDSGRYLGIQDSASHRYPFQWTGDIRSDSFSLGVEIRNLLRCSSNAIPFTNFDCGGHIGDPGPSLFTRWMEFASFTPIMRPHCCNFVKVTREPWVYGKKVEGVIREYMRIHYRLLPLFYQAAYVSFESGLPLVSPLAAYAPEDRECRNCHDEYLLFGDLLVAPPYEKAPLPIPPGAYRRKVSAVFYAGTRLEGEPLIRKEYPILDQYYHESSPDPLVPKHDFSALFTLALSFQKTTRLFVVSDDGIRVWVDGEKRIEDWNCHAPTSQDAGILSSEIVHEVRIEYFQSGGDATIRLLYSPFQKKGNEKNVYLPRGSWRDPFTGQTWVGGKHYARFYPDEQLPFFIREGALLPLAYSANNTKNQRWDRLVLDYYPSENAQDSGFLYEDDGLSLAYQHGEFRKTPYASSFDSVRNAFCVNLSPAVGNFRGDKCYVKRRFLFKAHLGGFPLKIVRVTVNGATENFQIYPKNPKRYPLSEEADSLDGDTLSFFFEEDVRLSYEILLFLG